MCGFNAMRGGLPLRDQLSANLMLQVWQFTLENVRLRMTGAGYSMPDICCDKAKVVCVDCKQFEPKAPS